MGRPVKIRESFTSDVTSLARLRDAVRKDIARPKKWREKVCSLLDKLIADLVTAPHGSKKEKA